jgi:hypothetical protein
MTPTPADVAWETRVQTIADIIHDSDAGFGFGSIERRRVAERIEAALTPPPATPPALDERRLAYAIVAAEGHPGFTPWASEYTNARLIAAEYERLTTEDPDHA